LKIFWTEVEKQSRNFIKIIRSDCVGEYFDKYGDAGQLRGLFAKYLENYGIIDLGVLNKIKRPRA